MLPMIEQANLYGRIDFNLPTGRADWNGVGGGGEQAVLANVRIAAFECPSDPPFDSPHTYTPQNMYTLSNATRVSYGFVHESTEYNANTGNLWARNLNLSRSAFGINSSANMRDITDGTSNTMLMIETPFRKQSTNYGPFLQAFTHTHFIIPTEFGINRWSVTTPKRLVYAWGAGSQHVGGAQLVLADGSVRFISENISSITVASLVSIAGGEVVGEF